MSGLTPTLSHGRGRNHKNGNPGLPFCITLPPPGTIQTPISTVFRAVQPVTFERTLHVFDGVDDVMVNQFSF